MCSGLRERNFIRTHRMTRPKMLDEIVSDYIRELRPKAAKEHRWFAIQRTLEDAVSLAARAKKPSGKRFSHQRRIPSAVLAKSEKALLDVLPAIVEASSFEKLHAMVSEQIGNIRGIGELTVYDTSLRIAAKLGLEPKLVFLHAGTRTGARRLGLDVSRGFLEVSDTPKEFRLLSPTEIEDVLCIYKDDFRQGQTAIRKKPGC
jgi:hypothetical protein